jgi:hypothetical protein
MTRRQQRGTNNGGKGSDFGRRLGERAPAQVQNTLDNWYTLHTRRRRRLNRGYLWNGGRDVRRTQVNNWTDNLSTHGRQQRRKRQLGLAHMYQYGDTGKVYGDMPLPVDEHDTLRHVGGNDNGIKTYANDKGMISMSSNLRVLQAGSASIFESNAEWQEYRWKENTYQTLLKKS